LQQPEGAEPAPSWHRIGGDGVEQRRQPGAVQQHEEEVVAGAGLDRASGKQRARIAPRMNQLRDALHRDQRDDDGDPAHASTSWNPAVKPGPSVVKSSRPATPARKARSSTKSTV